MVKKKHKKGQKGAHIDESWLLPYSDLMTLLLALFIVLFSSSTVDAQKWQQMSNVFDSIFNGGENVLDYEAPVEIPSDSTDNNPPNDNTSQLDIDEQLLLASEQKELAFVQQKLEGYIKDKGLEDLLQTSLTSDGLLLTIRDNVLFAPGSADVRLNDVVIAEEIAELLVMDPPREVVVSGHTDNVPIGNAPFESNWELSAMRALNFMKIVLKNTELDPKLFSAKGFGEHQPIASNDTVEGKSKNRRVEILIRPRTAADIN